MRLLAIVIVAVATAGVLGTHVEADGVPVHGNWCGPAHGKGEAVDALDRACMRHDQCYERRGYGDCQCDRRLVRDIDGLPGGGPSQAALVRSWFTSAQPCHISGIPVPPGVNTTVQTLTDDKLNEEDLKAVVYVVAPWTAAIASVLKLW